MTVKVGGRSMKVLQKDVGGERKVGFTKNTATRHRRVGGRAVMTMFALLMMFMMLLRDVRVVLSSSLQGVHSCPQISRWREMVYFQPSPLLGRRRPGGREPLPWCSS